MSLYAITGAVATAGAAAHCKGGGCPLKLQAMASPLHPADTTLKCPFMILNVRRDIRDAEKRQKAMLSPDTGSAQMPAADTSPSAQPAGALHPAEVRRQWQQRLMTPVVAVHMAAKARLPDLPTLPRAHPLPFFVLPCTSVSGSRHADKGKTDAHQSVPSCLYSPTIYLLPVPFLPTAAVSICQQRR